MEFIDQKSKYGDREVAFLYRFPICIISLGPEMFDAADADSRATYSCAGLTAA